MQIQKAVFLMMRLNCFGFFQLRIQATDVSNDTLTNSFLLTVLVVDVEDNKPAFNACRDVEVGFFLYQCIVGNLMPDFDAFVVC